MLPSLLEYKLMYRKTGAVTSLYVRLSTKLWTTSKYRSSVLAVRGREWVALARVEGDQREVGLTQVSTNVLSENTNKKECAHS